MPTGAQRFARQLLEQKAGGFPEKPIATVTAVNATGGTDGLALVTVSYNGASLPLPHKASYTPAVGHVVVLDRVGGQWVIDDRLIGFP
ncbi:MAG TPA: hypothetical protein VFV01_16910 [Spirillospora sp.]|nr:hypothetical protein [Spirillospora sp.]